MESICLGRLKTSKIDQDQPFLHRSPIPVVDDQMDSSSIVHFDAVWLNSGQALISDLDQIKELQSRVIFVFLIIFH